MKGSLRAAGAGLLAVTAIVSGPVTPSSAGPPGPSEWTHAVAWGSNTTGQLGTGSQVTSHEPRMVDNVHNGFTQVGAGDLHSLAVALDGTAWAWGANVDGQLGDGTTTRRLRPVPVAGLTGVTEVAGGGSHSLALRTNGTVWAWGANTRGQLGDGTTTDRLTPVPVAGLTGVAEVAGGGSHSLALRLDGTVWAWGANSSGQLGDGTTTSRLTPVRVAGLASIVDIAAGRDHSLAVDSEGAVFAWGGNSAGQVGDGTRNASRLPILVQGLGGVTTVGAGARHSLAVSNGGVAWAWGSNDAGQTGRPVDHAPTADNVQVTPLPVPGVAALTEIDGAGSFSTALRADGSVWAWGQGYGDGNRPNPHQPARVSHIGAHRFASGGSHTVAVIDVPAPPSFRVGVVPVVGGVAAGASLTSTVTTRAVNNSTQTVYLTASGLPMGTTAVFDPPSVTAGGSSTITLSTTVLTPPGTFPVVVTGSINGLSVPPTPDSSAAFALTVTEAKNGGCAGSSPDNIAIPDAGPAVTSVITIPGCATPDPSTSTVEVHIIHPRRGDLVIDLIGPGRDEVYRLKDSNPGDPGADVHHTFTVQLTGPVDGTAGSQWSLRVQDVVAGWSGGLESWSWYL